MRVCAIGLRGIPNVIGGIETHCENLYPRLAQLDRSLEIIVIGRSGHAIASRRGNVRVTPVWAPPRKALETVVHTPLAILYARLMLHPDVVHLHGVGPGFFSPLARLLGFRVIGTHHAADYDRPKWGRVGRAFLKMGERMMTLFADDVICVSNAIETHLRDKYPQSRQRLTTIRNGAPVSAPVTGSPEKVLSGLGLSPDRYILAVGRLDPTKRFHDLIAAFRKAAPHGLKLAIAGAGPVDDPYAAQLRGSAGDDVVFLGMQPARVLQVLYRNAALFVHPSCLEGFAMVVLEALEGDAPILLSDIPAHREAGLEADSYFPVGDVQELARRLAAGGYDRLRCARRTEILADNDWERVAQRHHAILVRSNRARADETWRPREVASASR